MSKRTLLWNHQALYPGHVLPQAQPHCTKGICRICIDWTILDQTKYELMEAPEVLESLELTQLHLFALVCDILRLCHHILRSICNQSILLWCELGHTMSPGQTLATSVLWSLYLQRNCLFACKRKYYKSTKFCWSEKSICYLLLSSRALSRIWAPCRASTVLCTNSRAGKRSAAPGGSLAAPRPSIHTNVSSVYLVLPQTLAFSTHRTFHFMWFQQNKMRWPSFTLDKCSQEPLQPL